MADKDINKRKEYGRKGAQIAAEKQKRKAAADRAHAEKIKKQGRPHKYTSGLCFAYKLALYFYQQDHTTDQDGRSLPYTVTGMQLAVNCNGSGWQQYKTGERDHINDEHARYDDTQHKYIEIDIYDHEKAFIYDCTLNRNLDAYICRLYNSGDYNAIHFSNILEKAAQIVEEQAEQRLYIKGRVADIFTMKSLYKWQDSQTTVHRVEIASPDQARKALEELKLLED